MIEPQHRIVRLRRRLVPDPMSGQDTLGSWDDADELELWGLFAPGSTKEFPNVDIEAVSSLATVYFPREGAAESAVDVVSTDRVRVDDALWSVEGRRADWELDDIGGSVVLLKLIREGV